MKVIHPFRTGAAGYGLERNISCTLIPLAKQGVDVVALIVTERRVGESVPALESRLEEAGVRIVRAASPGRLPFSLARRFREVFRAEQPDIIHSHDYKCDLAMLLTGAGQAARVSTVHGWCSRNAKERFYEWLNVQCLKRMDRVIVFCEEYRRRLLRRRVPERLMEVVPVGMDLDQIPREGRDLRAEWGVAADEILVGQVGRLSNEKGPDVFRRVAETLSATHPNSRWVLVGDGDLRAELERRAAAPLIFAGYVTGMADVFDALDIAVNCSVTEAMPRTLLEAGVMGVPVVATDVGGTSEIVQDGVTGVLCPPGDVEAIAAGVARFLEDPALRARAGAAARERMQSEFGLDGCARRLIEVYEAAISRPWSGS